MKPTGTFYNPYVINPPFDVFVYAWVDRAKWMVLKYVGSGWEDADGNAYQESGVWLWGPLGEAEP